MHPHLLTDLPPIHPHPNEGNGVLHAFSRGLSTPHVPRPTHSASLPVNGILHTPPFFLIGLPDRHVIGLRFVEARRMTIWFSWYVNPPPIAFCHCTTDYVLRQQRTTAV